MIKGTRVIAIGTMLALAGCSTTRVVTRDQQLFLERDAVVVLHNDAKLGARSVASRGDTVIAYDYYTNRELRFSFREVDRVVVNNRGRRALGRVLAGIVLGGLAGAIGGGILGYLAGEENPQDALESKGAAAIVVGFIYGCGGAAAGGLAGFMWRNKDNYLFEEGPVGTGNTPTAPIEPDEQGDVKR